MMNPFSWLQMTNMISYQGLVRTFPRRNAGVITGSENGPTMWGHSHFCLTAHRNMARESRRMKCTIRQSCILQEDPVTPHDRKGEPLKKALSPLCRHLGKRKRPLFLVAFRNSLILVVPEAGIEPARRERRGILNPLCLPISPLGHRNRYQARVAGLSIWRHVPESNRTKRICNPLHNRFANAPCKRELALYCLNLERETRLELATPTLARSCSTN